MKVRGLTFVLLVKLRVYFAVVGYSETTDNVPEQQQLVQMARDNNALIELSKCALERGLPGYTRTGRRARVKRLTSLLQCPRLRSVHRALICPKMFQPNALRYHWSESELLGFPSLDACIVCTVAWSSSRVDFWRHTCIRHYELVHEVS